MAALNDIHFDFGTIAEKIPMSEIRAIVAKEFWGWYENHKGDVVFNAHVWIFRHAIRVEEMEPLFEMLFGPKPAAPAVAASAPTV